ncbi:SGNH/GDSL hydrolase family protein [Sphingomonas melonis]|uniref:Lysophospholipase L1-like esterase n=1 Tax=Sphingomonas melonis TaxID=152682 RepID=A0A7Y9FQ20_9SPHN|nr:SGNH/GDSL hydrolase family protein [Sphingomonas melonis]NYD91047.1 lysophospholipase L1-like esterase [Sphingomonas melonis]
MSRFATLILGTVAMAASAHAAPAQRWGGAWGYATSPATKAVRGTLPAGTYRFRMRLSQSGDAMRVTFTNPEGALPLHIVRASAAIAGTGFGIERNTERSIRFEAGEGVVIAEGASLTSSPTVWRARGGEDVIVTVTTDMESSTVAGNAGFPAAFGAGVTDAAGSGLEPKKIRPFVTGIALRNPPTTCTIVTFGDSITEGARGSRTDWSGWPGTLAQRLVASGPRHCGVVNKGISGNRLLRDGRGTAGVDRFERDVASVSGVTDLVVLEGINDIWHAGQPNEPSVGAADLIAGYRRLIDAAHAHGIRIYGGTLTPGWGSKYLNPAAEQVRADVNRWIRTGGAFDGVIDFEAAVRDASTPPAIQPPFDSGDHLHPGDAGYAAMGNAVPLSLFPSRR